MNLISTASIGKTFGVNGFVYVYPFSGETKHLMKLTSCQASFPDGKEVELKVEKVMTHGDNLLMRFFGYETPEKAKLLSKAIIMVERDKAARLKKGEVYVADLINMELVFGDEKLAVVEGVSDGSQSILLHVKTYSDNKIRLVPYMQPFTGKADVKTKQIPLLMKELVEV